MIFIPIYIIVGTLAYCMLNGLPSWMKKYNMINLLSVPIISFILFVSIIIKDVCRTESGKTDDDIARVGNMSFLAPFLSVLATFSSVFIYKHIKPRIALLPLCFMCAWLAIVVVLFVCALLS